MMLTHVFTNRGTKHGTIYIIVYNTNYSYYKCINCNIK